MGERIHNQHPQMEMRKRAKNFHKSQKSDYFCGIISIQEFCKRPTNIYREKEIENVCVCVCVCKGWWHAFDTRFSYMRYDGFWEKLKQCDNGGKRGKKSGRGKRKGKPIDRTDISIYRKRWIEECSGSRTNGKEEKVNYTKKSINDLEYCEAFVSQLAPIYWKKERRREKVSQSARFWVYRLFGLKEGSACIK